jgi:hypothetical protein
MCAHVIYIFTVSGLRDSGAEEVAGAAVEGPGAALAGGVLALVAVLDVDTLSFDLRKFRTSSQL